MVVTKTTDQFTKRVFTNLIKWYGIPLALRVERTGFVFEKSSRRLALSCAILMTFNLLPVIVSFIFLYVVYGKTILDVFLAWRALGLTLTDTISLLLINMVLLVVSFRTLYHMHLGPKSITDISRDGMTLGHIITKEIKEKTMVRTLKKIAFLLSFQILLPFCFAYLFLVVIEYYDIQSNWKWFIYGMTTFQYTSAIFSAPTVSGLVLLWYCTFNIQTLANGINELYFGGDSGKKKLSFFKKPNGTKVEQPLSGMRFHIKQLIQDGNCLAHMIEKANHGTMGRLAFDESAIGLFYGVVGFFLTISPSDFGDNWVLLIGFKLACFLVAMSFMTRFLYLSSIGQKIANSITELKQNLRHCLADFRSELLDEEQLQIQLLKERFDDTRGIQPLNCFDLNYSSCLVVCGNLLTYLIVLLQFTITENTS